MDAAPAPDGRQLALTLRQFDVVARPLARVDLSRPRDLLLRVAYHLAPLRDPSRCPRYREQHREHVDLEPQRLINDPRVEVDVRVELALDEVVVFERDPLQFERDIDDWAQP